MPMYQLTPLKSNGRFIESSSPGIAHLEYGVEEELEEFARKLLILLPETEKETRMSNTRSNGLSTSSQQAEFSP